MEGVTATPSMPVADTVYELTELEIQADELCADEQDIAAEQAHFNYRRWVGFAFFCLVVFFLSWFFSRMESYLTDSSKMPMSELIIQGHRQYVTDNDVRAILLKNPAIENYFSVDVDRIQAKIESLPWVYRASIRKSWPDRVRVYIQEQPVVAFWNDDRLLNEDGIVFEADVSMAPKSLVKLYSPSDRIELVLGKYTKLNDLLQLNGYTIASLTLNLRNALTVVLSNGITLRLGREDAISRIQRYIDYVSALDKEKIDYIDLRYDTGFSVGWKNDDKE
ncbi:MAG: cell division protein FtsQ [Moritella sp.]|jgi:cell division protein FtsQ